MKKYKVEDKVIILGKWRGVIKYIYERSDDYQSTGLEVLFDNGVVGNYYIGDITGSWEDE